MLYATPEINSKDDLAKPQIGIASVWYVCYDASAGWAKIKIQFYFWVLREKAGWEYTPLSFYSSLLVSTRSKRCVSLVLTPCWCWCRCWCCICNVCADYVAPLGWIDWGSGLVVLIKTQVGRQPVQH